jgi:hypothetical protein
MGREASGRTSIVVVGPNLLEEMQLPFI